MIVRRSRSFTKRTISSPQLKTPQTGYLPEIKYVQIATHSRCNADCVFPFAYETQVITRRGVFPIGSLEGWEYEFLCPAMNNGTPAGSGVWKKGIVRKYGEQQIWELTLSKGSAKRVIRTTASHRWWVKKSQRIDGKMCHRHIVPTELLCKGDVIPECSVAGLTTTRHEIDLSVAGVRQGFVFGDGSANSGEHRAVTCDFHGEKAKDLKPWFNEPMKKVGREIYRIAGFSVEDKILPHEDLRKGSKSFLTGWLAGYFAADGSVSKQGQCEMTSSELENMEFVRLVCIHLGVRTSQISSVLRKGFGGESYIHRIRLDMADLPEKFFIRRKHRQYWFDKTSDRFWKVSSVKKTEVTESVYCTHIPDIVAFALEGNILTCNCPFSESSHAKMPGMMTDETFKLILDNLVPWKGSIQKICPYLMQEPLIDKTIFAKIAQIYSYFPDTSVEISTNGAALTESAVSKLFEVMSGRKHDIWVSHHGINKETLEHIMAIDYEKSTQNLIRLIEMSNGRFKIKIRGAGEAKATNKIYFTRQQYIDYWKEMEVRYGLNMEKVSIDSFQFHDRAGTLFRTDRGSCELNGGKVREIGPGHSPFYCPRLDQWIHFMWDGSIRLCCMDYHHEVKLPNIHQMSLLDYYYSDEYTDIVNKVSGRTHSDENFICKRCISPGG